MLNVKKRKVLFLCTGNSARSQMAEALLRARAGDKFEVYSAGTKPESVDSRTIEALENFGIDAVTLHSKSIESFENESFDYVITLCDKASLECRNFPNTVNQFAWDFPDPKTRLGNESFTVTLNELNNRISMFLLVENKYTENKTDNSDAVLEQFQSNDELFIDPVSFYKTLTDEIRLKTLMLTHYHGELCVCELMEAMDEDSQPKVSRNLAVLKKARVISSRKHGQWVFYRINPELPFWIKQVIAQTTENNVGLIQEPLRNLAAMSNRPNKAEFCGMQKKENQ